MVVGGRLNVVLFLWVAIVFGIGNSASGGETRVCIVVLVCS